MAYDEELARRVRQRMEHIPGYSEKRMFGGVAFMIEGNMAGGVHGRDLIVRLGPERYEEALRQPAVREFDLTGRAMAGWVTVGPEGVQTDDQLAGWIEQGVAFAQSLPAKSS
jgi:TfoX/Sxy family transcriptional regulator of competence genes